MFTPTNPINQDGVSAVPGKDNRSLGLKVYVNELFAAFTAKTIGLSLVTKKMVSAPFAQFYLADTFTDADVTVQTPGNDVVSKVQKFGEVKIDVEDLLTIATSVHKLDEKLSHIDQRTEMAKARGNALAQKLDKEVFKTIDSACFTATPGVGQKASSVVVNTAIASATTGEAKGDAILDGIFDLATEFDNKDVPEDGRIFVTNPANYNALVRSQKAVNRDFTNGNGGIDAGTVFKISGIVVLKSTNLPGTADVEGYLTTPRTVALAMALEPTSEADKNIRSQSWDFVDSMAYGIGVLDTTTAGVLKSA